MLFQTVMTFFISSAEHKRK